MSKHRPPLVPDIDRKQRNILPHDIIANDRDVNDVMWNGATSPYRMQRAGAIVMGSMLMLGGLGSSIIAVQHDSWFGIIPLGAIAAAGLRIVYKNLKPRTPAKRTH